MYGCLLIELAIIIWEAQNWSAVRFSEFVLEYFWPNWYFGNGSSEKDTIPLIKTNHILLSVICDVFCYVLHHLTLASCWLSSSVRALVSQSSACQRALPPGRAAEEQMGRQFFGRGQQRHHQRGSLINYTAEARTPLGLSGGKTQRNRDKRFNLSIVLYIQTPEENMFTLCLHFTDSTE